MFVVPLRDSASGADRCALFADFLERSGRREAAVPPNGPPAAAAALRSLAAAGALCFADGGEEGDAVDVSYLPSRAALLDLVGHHGSPAFGEAVHGKHVKALRVSEGALF